MRRIFLTIALASAVLVGSLAVTGTAEARPRWGGGYYGGYARAYYRPNYYGPRYYSGYYGPRYSRYYAPRYYSYPYRYSYRPGYYYGGPRAGVYLRF